MAHNSATQTTFQLSFFIIFIGIYCIINYYVGFRIWQGLNHWIPSLSARIYWPLFWIIAFSYLIGRAGNGYLPAAVSRSFSILGSYWFAVLYYMFLILLVIDLLRLIHYVFPFLPAVLTNPRNVTGAVGILIFSLLLYGAWNARHPRIVRYDVTIPKAAGSLTELKAVMVSDVHLGIIINNGRLARLVDEINAQNPDIVFMPGDIIDESVKPAVEQKMEENFERIRPKYGVYACLGNHEYIGGNVAEISHYLKQAGVKLLRDETVKVADAFYVVGRDDSTRDQLGKQSRGSLESILRGTDRSLPLILLDHKPVRFGESEAQGIDLQLSGHTHLGQLFPNQLITRRIFEVDWGYYRKNGFQAIVSDGYGTWGPPIRIGNRPELVVITVHFQPSEADR